MFILILLLCLFSFSCSQPVTMGISPEAGKFITDELFYETGKAWDLRPAGDTEPDILAISLEKNWRDDSAEPAGPLAVRTEILVPRVPFDDPRTDISLKELLENTQIPLVKPEDVPLTEKSLRVNGRYPDDPLYPLIRRTYLILQTKPEVEIPEGFGQALAQHIPAEPAPPEVLSVASVGDMMLQRGIENLLLGRDDGLIRVFGDTLPFLSAPDITTGNLEGAVTTGGTRTPKTYNFRFHPGNLELLKKAGFDYVSLTNNHSLDWGAEGFKDTLVNLKAGGLATSGAGMNLTESLEPYTFYMGSRTVDIYSLGAYPREQNGFDGYLQAAARDDRPGILWNTPGNLEKLSSRLNREHLNLILVHGGREWQSIPPDETRQLYRRLVDMGFSTVFGSHPHVLQGMEAYGSGLIYYSLGNFLFPGMEEMRYAEETMIATVGFYNNRPLYIENVFARISGTGVRLDETEKISGRFLELTHSLKETD